MLGVGGGEIKESDLTVSFFYSFIYSLLLISDWVPLPGTVLDTWGRSVGKK